MANRDTRYGRNWKKWLAIYAIAGLLVAAPLQGTQGRVGTVFGYQGQPSWAMVSLQSSIQEEGRFQVQVVTRDGRYLPVGDAVLGGAKATWGGQLPVDLSPFTSSGSWGRTGDRRLPPPSTQPTPGTDLRASWPHRLPAARRDDDLGVLRLAGRGLDPAYQSALPVG